MASEKRCLYEILGLNRDCSPEEIRSAYRKLALQRHPDKLIKTGVSEEEATASFQELVNAYEVLSDARERAWYDSHRSQILFSDVKSSKAASSVPDLFSFFSNSVFSGFGDTGKGFFKVYGDLFGKIYAQEVSFARKLGLDSDLVRDAPLMGNLDSPYEQVSAFYGYWLGFCTVMDFCWVDEYDAMAGPNRKSRRLMEDENKKLRKKAKRDYNDTVRGLAEFVKKRDKRVIEMQMKKNLEQEKKREEEKARKKEAERIKMERARLYEEPDWAKIEEEEVEDVYEEAQDDAKKNELYCVVCSKKFKSDKQWKNHEQSKKHREKLAELKYAMKEEDEIYGKQEEVAASNGDVDETNEDAVDELSEQFEDVVDLDVERNDEIKISSSDGEGVEGSDVNKGKETQKSIGIDDGISVLEAMAIGRKNKKNAATKRGLTMSSSKSYASGDDEEIDLMEYNNRRNTRRNRAAKKDRSKKVNGETGRAEHSEVVAEEILSLNGDSATNEEAVSNSHGNNLQCEEDDGHDKVHTEHSVSHESDESVPHSMEDPPLGKSNKDVKKPADKKGAARGDANIKLENISKGKKQKAKPLGKPRGKKDSKGSSKTSGHSCETCGEDFESRNKLHQHLGDTGHASLKSR